jgi:hypothetical protein
MSSPWFCGVVMYACMHACMPNCQLIWTLTLNNARPARCVQFRMTLPAVLNRRNLPLPFENSESSVEICWCWDRAVMHGWLVRFLTEFSCNCNRESETMTKHSHIIHPSHVVLLMSRSWQLAARLGPCKTQATCCSVVGPRRNRIGRAGIALPPPQSLHCTVAKACVCVCVCVCTLPLWKVQAASGTHDSCQAVGHSEKASDLVQTDHAHRLFLYSV